MNTAEVMRGRLCHMLQLGGTCSVAGCVAGCSRPLTSSCCTAAGGGAAGLRTSSSAPSAHGRPCDPDRCRQAAN